jgi:hypothetical protein
MKHLEEDFIDDALKNLNSSVIWNEKSKHQLRANIIKKISQEKIRNKRYIINNFIPDAISVFMIILVLLSLIVVYSDQSQIKNNATNNQNQDKDPSTYNINQEKKDAINNNYDSKFNISDQINKKIDEVKSSGFELRLPMYSPIDGTRMVNIIKKTSGNGLIVSATYEYQNKELFLFSQETIKQGERLETFLRKIEKESDTRITLNGNTAYFINQQAGKVPRKIVYIHTNRYLFTISSFRLTKNQLIEIASSIKTDNI